MKKVKIEWIDWVQKLTKKQLWATLLVPIAVLLILFVWRVSRGNEAYNSNWFIYFFTIFTQRPLVLQANKFSSVFFQSRFPITSIR